MFVARYKRKGRETASSNVSDIYFGCIIASYLIVLLRLSSHMRVNLEFSFCRSLFITYFVCNELEAFTCRTLRVSRIDWSIGRPMKRQISSRDTHTRFVCISCDYMKKKKKNISSRKKEIGSMLRVVSIITPKNGQDDRQNENKHINLKENERKKSIFFFLHFSLSTQI